MDRLKKLVKEKLCKKGEAYRKRRMAAGEKSSAYLSGRAVKVCKGQMSGKKKKKKTNENIERYSGGALEFQYKLKDLFWENIVYFFGEEQIGFPLPSDGINIIGSEGQFENWKQGMLKRYPNIIISVLPQGKGRYDKIEISDEEFNKDKEEYIDAKASALQRDREMGYSIDENIGRDLGDYNEDMEKVIDRGIKRINIGSSDEEDVLYYVHNNWMGGNLSAEEAMKKISKYISPMRENIDPKAQKKHKGKVAPYGSAYKELNIDEIAESLRDWFKKEDWVRINTSGNISGKCGTMKKGKATTRCLPRKKAQSLTKAERKATVAKKVRGSKKGKQFVKNTKKSEFKK